MSVSDYEHTRQLLAIPTWQAQQIWEPRALTMYVYTLCTYLLLNLAAGEIQLVTLP